MKPDLVLVANATQARLFRRSADPSRLHLLDTLEQAEGRAHASELVDDRAGHGSSDHRPGGTSFAPRIDPKRKRHLAFARVLADRIEQELAGGGYGHLALFAACPFRGELEGLLEGRAKASLQAAVDLDLTGFGVHELEQRVESHLQPAS